MALLRSAHSFARALLAAALSTAVLASAQQPDAQRGPEAGDHADLPRTVPERTEHGATSTVEQVRSFLSELEALPHADRLRARTIGETTQGRELVLVTVADPMPEAGATLREDPRLRVLVNGNIHGGEVEGKEAIQALLREFANGDHEALLGDAIFLFVPVYNADGNDDLAPDHRVSQNGPDAVGNRPNANGLDLNRDFVKAESAECRILLEQFRRHDPHVFVDLHTTNGSRHAYHLTWAPSLSTNVHPAIDGFARGTLLPEVQRRCAEEHGIRTFPYGNLSGRRVRRWITYDHRPRFGTNYYGLRNRFGVLSEAYSYADFETRIRATRAFTLELLRSCAARSSAIRDLCARADRALANGQGTTWFGHDTTFAPGTEQEVLLGSVDEIETEHGTRRAMTDEQTPTDLLVVDRFYSRQQQALPVAWWVAEPPAELIALLERHGIAYERLQEVRNVRVASFEIEEASRSPREFQGHHEMRVTGRWSDAANRRMPTGALRVSAQQPLGRLAAQLLEPLSEDSATTWNYLDAQITEPSASTHPVLREPAPRRR